MSYTVEGTVRYVTVHFTSASPPYCQRMLVGRCPTGISNVTHLRTQPPPGGVEVVQPSSTLVGVAVSVGLGGVWIISSEGTLTCVPVMLK